MRWFAVFMLCGVMSAAETSLKDEGANTSVAELAAAKLEQTRAHYQASELEAMAAAAEEGLALLETAEDVAKLRGALWYWSAVSQEMLGDSDAALERYRTALSIHEAADNRREVAAALNSMANLHGWRGEQALRFEALVQARTIFEALGELRGRAAVANSLGNYYDEMAQYEEAHVHFERSVALRREMDSPGYLAAGLLGLGMNFRALDQPEKAEVMLREGLAIYRELEDAGGLANILTNLGNLSRSAGNYPKALEAYREALGYDEATGYKYGQTILKHNIALTYQALGDLPKALSWADRAVDAAEDLENPERLENAYNVRSATRELQGDHEGALADLRRKAVITAERTEAAREEALLSLQTRFETAEKEREIEQLERAAVEQELALAREESGRMAAEQAQEIQAARSRTMLVLAIAAGLAALILAGMFRISRRAERRLARQREEVEQALAGVRAAHAELKRIYDRKSEWLGFAAHDLRSPLFAIDAVCGEIERKELESPQEGVGEIRVAAKKMREELDAWLEAERKEQHEITLHPVRADLAKISAEVIALNGATARAKDLRLDSQNDGEVTAAVDPWRWREVVDNLVSNAIKFTPQGGAILVITRLIDGRVELRVQDEGPGISSDDRQRLFGAYTQLTAQPTGSESSTGLGLRLVKRIVDAHRGKIEVEDAAGGGAIFVVSIPLNS